MRRNESRSHKIYVFYARIDKIIALDIKRPTDTSRYCAECLPQLRGYENVQQYSTSQLTRFTQKPFEIYGRKGNGYWIMSSEEKFLDTN